MLLNSFAREDFLYYDLKLPAARGRERSRCASQRVAATMDYQDPELKVRNFTRLRRKVFELWKASGETCPNDLFTKHLESGKKLKQLVGVFNCHFRGGRPDAAPKLKRAAAHPLGSEGGGSEHAAVVVEGLLPHLHDEDGIRKECPTATPIPESYGEKDVSPGRELGDAVPRLSRGRAAAGKP